MPGDLMVLTGERYENQGVGSGTAYGRQGLTQGGMGTDWGDYDGDGRPDLVVATFQSEPNTLYHSEGQSFFLEVGAQMGLAGETTRYVAWTARFLDVDNDGWLDLLFTNGHSQDNVSRIEPDRTYAQPIQLFRSEKGQRLRLDPDALPTAPIVGRGAAFGDYDNDGRIDALIVDEEGPAQLLHNEGSPSGHWLGVRLRGARSNRDGIGARITVAAGGRTLTRDLQLTGGYLSAHDPRVHFGLGQATIIESVRVRWPSGHVDQVTEVPVDRYVEVLEGRGLQTESARLR
jgi:hypothetical protein